MAINMTTWEATGYLCRDWYVAEVERVNARNQRLQARKSHPCILESEHHETPCWYNPRPSSITSTYDEWCENCLYVQPFYTAYHKAAKKAQRLRYQLTRNIKCRLLSESG